MLSNKSTIIMFVHMVITMNSSMTCLTSTIVRTMYNLGTGAMFVSFIDLSLRYNISSWILYFYTIVTILSCCNNFCS